MDFINANKLASNKATGGLKQMIGWAKEQINKPVNEQMSECANEQMSYWQRLPLTRDSSNFILGGQNWVWWTSIEENPRLDFEQFYWKEL